VNGRQVAAGDVDALYESMKVIAQNPRLAQEWGHASRQKARDLTPEAGAEKWIEVFDTLGGGHLSGERI
jgi:glycosyltransferase involved in cell wall biosynthesis